MGLFKKKKKKSGRKAATPVAVPDSDDDISLLSEDSDWEAERAALAAALSGSGKAELSGTAGDPFEHASLWAEVDRDELERIALNIARNAVPPAAAAGSDENAEAAARLNISAAVAENAEVYDSTDPLGYGRIDTRLLTLSRELGAGGAGSKPRYAAARGSLLVDPSGRRTGLAGRGPGRGGPADDASSGAQGEAPSALRAKVLPGSEQFDAALYLGTIHSETALPELLRGLHALRQHLSEHTGQLKSLVKENFDRFTSSKNTIDTVYAKLQKAEAEGEAGVHGSSTQEVLEAVLQVQDEARRAFGPLLARQAKADRIRLVLGVMQRYESVVQLPSRVRQHAEAGDYDQVIADYKKAKALLADQGSSGGSGGNTGAVLSAAASSSTGRAAAAAAATAPGAAGAGSQPPQQQQQGDGSIWAKLMVEIDKVVGSVAHSLETAVRSAQSGPVEALDAMRRILQLRDVGVPAAQAMEPVGLYVASQERHVRALLEGALAQHSAALEALRRAQRESEEMEAQGQAHLGGAGPSPGRQRGAGGPVGSSSSGGRAGAGGGAASPAPASGLSSAAATPRRSGSSASSEAIAAAAEAEAVRYISLITVSICQWLPEYWALTQQRLPTLVAEVGDAAAAVERGTAAAERSVAILLGLYRSAVQNVLATPAATGLTHAGLLSAAAELAGGCQLLQAGSGAGGAASVPMSQMHPGALECLQQLTGHAIYASLEQLATHLQAAVAQLCAAESYRLTGGSRRAGQPCTASVAALQQLVQQGMQHLQAALAEAKRAGIGLQGKAAASARSAFFGCFSAFAAGVGGLANALLAGQQQQQQQQAPSLAAAAAAAAAPSGGGDRDRDHDPAEVSTARRLLVLCANLGAARNGLLPRQFARWVALLQAGGSSGKELQAAVQACGAELEGAETRLAGEYIDRKQAVLDEVMEQLLFTGGTAWEVAPLPLGLRPILLELVHALAAVQAELAATAPSLLHEALEELLLGTLDGFAQVLAQGAPEASAGGVLQLWLEGTFLLSAVSSLAGEGLQQAAGRLRAALDRRLEAAVSAAAAAGGQEAAQLADWAACPASVRQMGPGASRVSVEACHQRLARLCKAAQEAGRWNLAPLRHLPPAPRT